jgi:hypothetical protein
MKKMFLLAVTFLLSFTPATTMDGFSQLFQLTGGTWKMKTDKGFTCEQWKTVGDAELSGQSFKVTGNDTTLMEQVQLIKKGMEVFYIPTVKGENNGQPVPFKLVSVYNGTFTFSNPNHDYPQVIVYELISKNELNAWIDGHINGKQKRIDYHYKRVME